MFHSTKEDLKKILRDADAIPDDDDDVYNEMHCYIYQQNGSLPWHN